MYGLSQYHCRMYRQKEKQVGSQEKWEVWGIGLKKGQWF